MQIGPRFFLKIRDAVAERVVVGGAVLLFELREFGLEIEIVRGVRHPHDRLFLRLLDAREDAVERVVIRGRNRIEFVVVAASAGDGHSEKALRHGVDPVVDDVVVVVEPLANGEEAEGGEREIVLAHAREPVGGELFEDEPVVGLVGVERLDDVVAIRPRAGVAVVLAVAVDVPPDGVGVAGRVEPEAAPTLAVMRRCEEAVDDFFVGVRRGVREKRRHVARLGRQAGQIVAGAAEQRLLVGLRGRIHPVPLEIREDETIDRRAAPLRVFFDRRHRRIPHGLVGPVIFRLLGETREFRNTGGFARIGRAHFHPLLQRGDFIGTEFFALGRHLQLGVGVAHRDDEPALVGIAGHEHRAVLAAFFHAVGRVQSEAALRLALLDAVALVAFVREDRADFAFKKSRLLRREIRAGCARDCEEARKNGDGLVHGVCEKWGRDSLPSTGARVNRASGAVDYLKQTRVIPTGAPRRRRGIMAVGGRARRGVEETK